LGVPGGPIKGKGQIGELILRSGGTSLQKKKKTKESKFKKGIILSSEEKGVGLCLSGQIGGEASLTEGWVEKNNLWGLRHNLPRPGKKSTEVGKKGKEGN